jgi:glucuronoarabinoxylan endo-1,4-beta-xylanase
MASPRMARRWPTVLAALALALWTAMAWAQAPVQVSVDGAQKFQTIDGFGTAVYLYMQASPFRDPRIQQMYAVDSGNSLLRMELNPGVLPQKVDNVEEISWKAFDASEKGKAANTEANLEFAQAVIKLNPRIRFTPTVWSPPGWMKSNGKSDGGGFLLPQYYPHYAKYLAEWVKFVKEKYGLDMYAVGVQNELEFAEPYNCCQYTPAAWRDMLIEVHKRFEAEGIKTKIFGPESMTGSQNTPLFVRAVMEDPQGKSALDIIATHGYSDGIKMAGGAKGNSTLWDAVSRYKLPVWMTETSGVKGDLASSLKGVAQEIHNSLVYGQISGWIYWQYIGSNAGQGNEFDMVLVKVGRQGNQEVVTEIVPSKKYYLHKQFSRFIQPGAVRIAATPSDAEGISVGAFEHAEDKTVTVTLINTGGVDQPVVLALKTNLKATTFDVYRTSAAENCDKVGVLAVADGKLAVTVAPQSMVTLYGKEMQ